MAIYDLLEAMHEVWPSSAPESWIDDTSQQSTGSSDAIVATPGPSASQFATVMRANGVHSVREVGHLPAALTSSTSGTQTAD